ncbi:MAG: hypothetical protein KDA32_01710 [Phycisphaerales bacterium]|nr:hypothetical protein [Phycisphaerales bacterium]
MRPRVLLPVPLTPVAEARLERRAEVIRPPDTKAETLLQLVANCDAILARTNVRIDRAFLAAGRRLRVVGVAGVGTDRVDLAAAAEMGISVLSTPEAASDAVAEFTLGLLLSLMRPIAGSAAMYRDGRFAEARREPHGVELRGKTVGIVGMGRIGSRVARTMSRGFDARIVYTDIIDISVPDVAATRIELCELLETAEVVSLHTPLTDATRGMIDAAALARMREHAFLINTARGAVIDTVALVETLRAGRIRAALDVTDPEPLPTDHPLFSLPNCLLTPHVAARTHAGMERMMGVVDEVLTFLGVDVPV